MRFPVVLHTDDRIHYGVTVPDLPGCFSSGDDLDSALASVAEAIDLHLEGLAEEGLPFPEIKTIIEHRNNPDFADGIWAMVNVDVSGFPGGMESFDVSLPQPLVSRIDARAKSLGVSRNEFLADAARRALR